jgi:hypothetical protein
MPSRSLPTTPGQLRRLRRSELIYARQALGGLPCTESPAGVAQLAERPSCKRQVSGSNPLTGSRVNIVTRTPIRALQGLQTGGTSQG